MIIDDRIKAIYEVAGGIAAMNGGNFAAAYKQAVDLLSYVEGQIGVGSDTSRRPKLYAAPDGAGTGETQSTAMALADIPARYKPGMEIAMVDGVYRGARNMLNFGEDDQNPATPPTWVRGTAQEPVRIFALNDGAVRIDGEGKRIPCYIAHSHFIELSGFDACNSSGDVIAIYDNAEDITIRRVCAWDAELNGNTSVVGVFHNRRILLEDVAAWGIGRKTFQVGQGANDSILRRCFGMWSKSGSTMPKETFSIAYENYRVTAENCIGTMDIEADSNTDGIYGIFAPDWYPSGDPNSGSAHLGCWAFTLPGQTAQWIGAALWNSNKVNDMTWRDNVVTLSHALAKVRMIDLWNDNPALTNIYRVAPKHVYERNTTIGVRTKGDVELGSQWIPVDSEDYALRPTAAVLFDRTASRGARLWGRYENGVFTNTPLFPWPMNDRIIAGMKASGRKPIDINATAKLLLGWQG